MEILIWGDDMKRQISVSIFLAVLVITLAWLYIKFNNEARVENERIVTENEVSKEQSVTISQDYTAYPYYIKEEYGKLVVYESKSDEIYMETSIGIYTLPQDIRTKIESGIFFSTEQELYDFLESYSS